MQFGVDEHRLVIEIIATLVNVKNTMAELILKPAGVPKSAYCDLLYHRDETTGKLLAKRQIAPLILDAVDKEPNASSIIRSIIEIASRWSSFHLAQDEFAARAAVQKAREVLGEIEIAEAREAKQRELARKEELARMELERVELIRRQSDLLLMMFDDFAASTDHQKRGYSLQDLLNRTFDLHGIPVYKSFKRNSGAEQIDGAFRLEGWLYLVECRWRAELADIRELDGLLGQVGRSGKQAMGLFISINGWSKNVPDLLKQNAEKAIILMEGYDLRGVLSGRVDFRDFLMAKIDRLNSACEPFLGVNEYLKGCNI